MEPDAWRCRRTDGRKWRCRRNVVPDQKYCDRHLHRGCDPSRKHVEPEPPHPGHQAVIATSAAKTTWKPSNSLPADPVPENAPFPSPPAILIDKTQNPGGDTVTATPAVKRPAEISVPGCLSKAAADLCLVKPTPKVRTEVAGVSANGDGSSVKSSYGNITSGSRRHNNNNNNNNNVSQALRFSPKSVLSVEPCSGLCFYGVISSEDEPGSGRCRRTDGKTWRCRRDVVSNHKYCERHLYRGAKRRPQSYPAVGSAVHSEPSILPRKADCASVQTTSSIATQTAAPDPSHGNASTSNTSSDATISDDGFIATGAN